MATAYERRKAQWNRLTSGERSFFLLHPWYADDIEAAAEKALSEAQDRFGDGSLHNGAGDAFRHCYWTALLARDIGKDNALAFTTAHEANPGNPPAEKKMDLHNNAVGAEIGAARSNSSDAELAMACFDALLSGKLVTISP